MAVESLSDLSLFRMGTITDMHMYVCMHSGREVAAIEGTLREHGITHVTMRAHIALC
jgi:hypothetical protein